MTKAIFKDEKSLQLAKRMACGVINYRQMKDGRIIAAKRPTRRKRLLKK